MRLWRIFTSEKGEFGSATGSAIGSAIGSAGGVPRQFTSPGQSDCEAMERGAERRSVERAERANRWSSLRLRLEASEASLKKEVDLSASLSPSRQSGGGSSGLFFGNGSGSRGGGDSGGGSGGGSGDDDGGLEKDIVDAEALARSARR